MNRRQPSSEQNPTRKRRAHRKSRAGCRNCKLRRVKCDETRPACRNCIGLFVTCNYDSTSPSASTAILDGDFDFSVSEAKLVNDVVVTVFNSMVTPQYPQKWDSRQFRPLNKRDIDRLKRWHTRTVFSLGTSGISNCYQLTVSKEASQYPYLLHAVLAMTAMHDRYFLASEQSYTAHDMSIQYYHHSCAAALFNERLSRASEKPMDRNSIWTTAVILGNMSACIMKTYDPEKSWPLTPSSDSNLEWMVLNQGLFTIYNLSLPVDPGGMFHELFFQDPDHSFLKNKWKQDTREGIDGIPFSFIALYELNPYSNPQNNPYHASVRALVEIWQMECTPYTAFRFLTFIALLRPEMKELLVQKDARALLLLAYWYTKMFHVHWWLHKRSVVECAAICIYLKRYHSADTLMMNMLQYPLSRLEEFREVMNLGNMFIPDDSIQ